MDPVHPARPAPPLLEDEELDVPQAVAPSSARNPAADSRLKLLRMWFSRVWP
jgi:hypothetical protein